MTGLVAIGIAIAGSASGEPVAPLAPVPTDAPTDTPAPAPAPLEPTVEPAGVRAQPHRRRHASWREIAEGPFRSSRLFSMPVADVVGAYQLAASGEGSLLQQTGVLSSAGAIAIGFGDIAQLEYRDSAAISIGHTDAPLPAAGVQLELPLRERPYVPAFAIAFRLGVPRREMLGATTVDETVTDLYLVARLQLWGALEAVVLHGGARISSANVTLGGDRMDAPVSKLLVLPAFGFEIATGPRTRAVGEIELAPQFQFDPTMTGPATIGRGVLARLGVKWSVIPTLTLEGSLGYQLDDSTAPGDGVGAFTQWDIRLGAEVFVPWGAIVCRAVGAFCE